MISTAHDSPRNTDIQAHLESLPLFSELSGPEIELLVPLCRVLNGSMGHYILEEGVAVHDTPACPLPMLTKRSS